MSNRGSKERFEESLKMDEESNEQQILNRSQHEKQSKFSRKSAQIRRLSEDAH